MCRTETVVAEKLCFDRKKQMQTDLDCRGPLLYNYLGVSSIVVANEGKASRPPSSSFTGDVDITYIPVLLKQRLQVLE